MHNTNTLHRTKKPNSPIHNTSILLQKRRWKAFGRTLGTIRSIRLFVQEGVKKAFKLNKGGSQYGGKC